MATLLAGLADRGPAKPSNGLGELAAEWLTEISRALAPEPKTTPKSPEDTLYIARLQSQVRGPGRLLVTAVACRRLRDGGHGEPLRTITSDSQARFITDQDREILRWLKAFGEGGADNGGLGSARGLSMWQEILATGRCYWDNKDGGPLNEGPTRKSAWEWRLEADGSQRLGVAGAAVVLPLVTPWYLDPQTRLCGPLDLATPDSIARILLTAPRLAVEEAAQVVATFKSGKWAPSGLPTPLMPAKELRKEKGVPHLHLTTATLTVRPRYRYQAGADVLVVPIARLSLRYGTRNMPWWNVEPIVRLVENGKIIEITTHKNDASAALLQLQKLGFGPLVGDDAIVVPEGNTQDLVLWDRKPGRLEEITDRELPKLVAAGWHISYADDYPYRPIPHHDTWYGNIQEGAGQDWFGVELGILVDGEPVNLLPALLRLIKSCPEGMSLTTLQNTPATDRFTIPLEKGRVVTVPAGRVAAILAAFIDLYDQDLDDAGFLRLSGPLPFVPEQLAQEGAPIRWQGGEKVRALNQTLRREAGVPHKETPAGLRAVLRPYQAAGFHWLTCLAAHGLNGVLADDMGLGKTLQTLALLQYEKEQGRLDRPCLIVAPTSLMDNWFRESARFTPNFRVLILQGAQRSQHFADLAQYDLILTTYPLLARDQSILNAQEYHYLVLDEAHIIKNPRTHAARVVRQLKARHRLALTGTPMENHLGELWALFDFLMPGLLGEERHFVRHFRTPIEKHNDGPRRQALQQRIAPFLLRRTKEVVASELPPKTEIIRTVTLSGGQRDLYETLRLAMHDKIRTAIANKGLARSRIVILDALLKLRQACCDPRLVKLRTARKDAPSAKLLLLREMLPALVEEGRQILLFSQFTSMLALIADELVNLKIPYVTLTGDTQDRKRPVDDFQEGRVPVFLISLKAGGTGLNLTAADTVIHYDPWWNPSVEHQATDRAHRLGQTKPVFVYKLIAEGTVEDKILALQAHKLALASSLWTDADKDQPRLEESDLESLFAPLADP